MESKTVFDETEYYCYSRIYDGFAVFRRVIWAGNG